MLHLILLLYPILCVHAPHTAFLCKNRSYKGEAETGVPSPVSSMSSSITPDAAERQAASSPLVAVHLLPPYWRLEGLLFGKASRLFNRL